MDTEMEELKELVRHNTKLAEDTNRIVHSMRSSARWGRIMSFAWWLFILGLSGVAYYYFLGPYIAQLQHLYSALQSGSQQAGDWQRAVSEFFKNFTPQR